MRCQSPHEAAPGKKALPDRPTFCAALADMKRDVYKRQIVKYTLPEDNHQIFASKYFTYLPTEEELKHELNLDDFYKLEE